MNLETNGKAFAKLVANSPNGPDWDEKWNEPSQKLIYVPIAENHKSDNRTTAEKLANTMRISLVTKPESVFTTKLRAHLEKSNKLRAFEDLNDFERAEIVRRKKDGESLQTLATAFSTSKGVILRALEDKDAISKASFVASISEKLAEHYKQRGQN